MKRRSFLALLGLAPAATAVASTLRAEPTDESAYPLKCGKITSRDGRMVLDLDLGTMEFKV